MLLTVFTQMYSFMQHAKNSFEKKKMSKVINSASETLSGAQPASSSSATREEFKIKLLLYKHVFNNYPTLILYFSIKPPYANHLRIRRTHCHPFSESWFFQIAHPSSLSQTMFKGIYGDFFGHKCSIHNWTLGLCDLRQKGSSLGRMRHTRT